MNATKYNELLFDWQSLENIGRRIVQNLMNRAAEVERESMEAGATDEEVSEAWENFEGFDHADVWSDVDRIIREEYRAMDMP